MWVLALWFGFLGLIAASAVQMALIWLPLPADSRITLMDLLPMRVRAFVMMMPMLGVPLAIAPALVLHRLRASAKAREYCICTRCRYDRSGTMQTPTCPECGLAESGEDAVRRWKLFCSQPPANPALMKWYLGLGRAGNLKK